MSSATGDEQVAQNDGLATSDQRAMNLDQYSGALAVVKREYERIRPSKIQRILFVLFNVSVYGSIIFFFVAMSFLLIPVSVKEGLVFFTGLEIVVSGVGSFFVLMIPVLLVANLPFFLKLGRNRRLISRLGIEPIVKAPWTEATGRTRILRRFSFVMAVLAIAFLVVVLIAFVFDPSEVLALLFLVPFLLAPSGVYLLLRAKNRLEALGDLERSLLASSAATAGDEQIQVPTETYQRVAQVEQAQIYRDRLSSVAAFAPHESYAVQRSKGVRAALGELDPSGRIDVEHLIDELATQPHHADSGGHSSSGRSETRLTDLGVEVEFSVNDESQVVRIEAVQRKPGNVGGKP